jgi:hypothetical protein
MRRRAYFITGLFLILIGTFLFVNSFQSITGLVIMEGVDSLDSGFAGGFFIFAGLFSLFLSKKRRKGQAAVEFLMTYGWAILAAVIAIGVLAYFGVFSPGKFVVDTVLLSPPLYAVASDMDNSQVIIEFRNSGSETIDILEANAVFDNGLDCPSVQATFGVKSGETKVINIPCPLQGGTRVKGEITIKYRRQNSFVDLISRGTVTGKVKIIPLLP